MMPYGSARVISAGRVVLALSIGGGAALAPATSPLAAQSASRAVRVTGSVLDSLTGAPLTSASVHFAREDDPAASATAARTDAEGRYEISLTPGRWLAEIEHPHFDSLGVTLPVRRVEIPEKPSFRLTLATTSARTLKHAYCGDGARDDESFVVGIVEASGSGAPLDSAAVFVQWSNLRFARGGVVVSTPTAIARTDRNGWYVLCGLPKRAAIVGWAERGASATGLVEAQPSDGPVRLDP
jgi:hypothetical protein